MQQTINLAAGVRQRIERPGRYFMVLDTGVATDVEVWLFNGSQELQYMRTAERGTKMRLTDTRFTHAEMKSSVNAVCEIVASDGLVDIDLFNGAAVNATIVNPIPVPVSNDRGSPGNLLHVTAVTAADTPAVAITDLAHVAVNDTLDALVAANANRREVRFTNFGPNPVAIGMSVGLTWAKRTIVLEVGDTHYETRAANLAWSAICNATHTADVGIQEVTT
jgi:hypothetical protein